VLDIKIIPKSGCEKQTSDEENDKIGNKITQKKLTIESQESTKSQTFGPFEEKFGCSDTAGEIMTSISLGDLENPLILFFIKHDLIPGLLLEQLDTKELQTQVQKLIDPSKTISKKTNESSKEFLYQKLCKELNKIIGRPVNKQWVMAEKDRRDKERRDKERKRDE
jgi:hypothetical protein